MPCSLSHQVQLGEGSSHADGINTAKSTRGHPEPSRVETEWTGVASMLMGVGDDSISLMGDGASIIFEILDRGVSVRRWYYSP